MKKSIVILSLIFLSFNCWSQSLNRINWSVDYLSCSCMKATNINLSDSTLIHCYQYLFDGESDEGCSYALDSLGNDLYSLRVITQEKTVTYQISSNQFHYQVYLFKQIFNNYNSGIQRTARMYFLQTIHNLINS